MEKTIYRFKFSDDIIDMISRFSKVHEYDDRKVFKEEWDKWVDENKEKITDEEIRLKEEGYEGDVNKKLFHAARYYFRKKDNNSKKEKKERTYIKIDPEILCKMDEHIKCYVIDRKGKPSEGYINFWEENKNIISKEIEDIKFNNNIPVDEIKNKIKKTYKNRYNQIINK